VYSVQHSPPQVDYVDFSTKPIVSTFGDFSTKRVNFMTCEMFEKKNEIRLAFIIIIFIHPIYPKG